jgi:hypothetical protein
VHEALGTAAVTGGTVLALRALERAGAAGPALLPAVAVLAVALCAPLALVGRRAERMVERWNERLYALAELRLEQGRAASAARVNLYGLALPFGIAFVLAPLGAAVAAAAIPPFLSRIPGTVPLLGLGWVAFVGFACASGAKALRAPRAPVFYFAALVTGLSCIALATLAGGAS